MNRINSKKQLDKLILFLFFALHFLTIAAQNAEKKVTIQHKNISLKEVFAQIELQTGYSIAYEQSNLNLSKTQMLSFKETSVDNVLLQVETVMFILIRVE